jgi:hypothetical protein
MSKKVYHYQVLDTDQYVAYCGSKGREPQLTVNEAYVTCDKCLDKLAA